MMALIAALLSAALVAPSPPKLDAESLQKLRAGEVLSESAEEGDSKGSVRALAIIFATPEAAFEVLTDHSKFAEFMPRIDKVEVTRRTAVGERVAQTVNATLTTVRYTLDYRWDAPALRVEFTLADDAPHDIKSAVGSWQLWELDGGRAALLEYRTRADIGRSVPGPIKRWLQSKGAGDAVGALKQRIESGGRFRK